MSGLFGNPNVFTSRARVAHGLSFLWRHPPGRYLSRSRPPSCHQSQLGSTNETRAGLLPREPSQSSVRGREAHPGRRHVRQSSGDAVASSARARARALARGGKFCVGHPPSVVGRANASPRARVDIAFERDDPLRTSESFFLTRTSRYRVEKRLRAPKREAEGPTGVRCHVALLWLSSATATCRHSSQLKIHQFICLCLVLSKNVIFVNCPDFLAQDQEPEAKLALGSSPYILLPSPTVFSGFDVISHLLIAHPNERRPAHLRL